MQVAQRIYNPFVTPLPLGANNTSPAPRTGVCLPSQRRVAVFFSRLPGFFAFSNRKSLFRGLLL